MKSDDRILRVGTRTSGLALWQTRDAIGRLGALFSGFRFEEVGVSSPGDRDRSTDLRESPPDFFTRDLDDKLLAGEIDLAVHSAKDLPDPVREGIDWYWLPWREDPRDVLIRPAGLDIDSMPADGSIGVSSGRRADYCRRRFPAARQKPIRGNIEDRLAQLDEGRFDLIVMAGAALNRLGLQDRITEWIPLADLPAPDGQGYLAVTFRKGDARLQRMRSLFVKTVTFAAASVGAAGKCTLENLKAIQSCDVCIHDVLMGPDLMSYIPERVETIDVGKRCGAHNLPQDAITELITVHARRGRRVVRLKGGDPGVFGRLAEEVEALEELGLPYRSLPGVTSLTAATTTTGMLLTRRGLSRGFCVMSPRVRGGAVAGVKQAERAKLPMVFFMGVSVSGEVARQLIEDGTDPQTPAAIVFGGGGDESFVVSAPLSEIGAKADQTETSLPGLLVVGDVTRYRFRTELGALQGSRVLLTMSDALQDKASQCVVDFGGVPVSRPLIRLALSEEGLECVRRIREYDWVVVTSPSSVRCFGELLRRESVDVRSVPKIVSCGGGTSEALMDIGFRADVEPDADFGAEGLLKAVGPFLSPGARVLRLRSDKAGPYLAESLRHDGAAVDDCILYRNVAVTYDEVPRFDAVLFASASAVESFDALWGRDLLRGKTVAVIGKPTLAALTSRGFEADIVGPEATVESCLGSLAEHYVRKALAELDAVARGEGSRK